MKIVLLDVRLAFPKIWKPEAVKGSDNKAYSAAFLLHPDHPQIDDIEETIDKVGAEMWGPKDAPRILATMRGRDYTCLHNGDLKADLDGYAGNYFINARNQARPLVIGRNKEVLTEDDGIPYAGCYVNASLEIWAQDNEFGKKINASLAGVQFWRDGDAFSGGRPASPDDFPEGGLGIDRDVDSLA